MIKNIKKEFQKVFVALGLALALVAFTQILLPTAAIAAEDPCITLQQQIDRGGFNVNSQLPVYCSTGSIYNKFLNVALYAIGIVAVIAIIYGGFLYMTSGANEEQRKRGRSVLTWAVIGLAVVILATLLVNVIIGAIVL